MSTDILAALPELAPADGRLFEPAGWGALEQALPGYMRPRRWFSGKARAVGEARVQAAIPLLYAGQPAYLTLVRVAYADGGAETYLLPLAFAGAARTAELAAGVPHALVARAGPGALFDPIYDPAFCAALLDLIAAGARVPAGAGELVAETTGAFARLRGPLAEVLAPKVSTAEQSNSSIIFGDRLILKLFRRLEPGLNPDLEIGRFLTERGQFANIPPLAGALEYHHGGTAMSVALLQGFVPNHGDSWYYTLDTVAAAFGRLLAEPALLADPAALDAPGRAADTLLGEYAAAAELLGQRTGELHLALAAGADDPAFAPEPCTPEFQRGVYASMESRARQAIELLGRSVGSLPAETQPDARRVLELEPQIFARLRAALEQPIDARRIRVHGDYHLGQVLYTGADFFIIDFEGEPARPLDERRVKSLATQDLAGMLRSFHYAPYAVLFGQAPGVAFGPAQQAALEPWARGWHRLAAAAFLRSYRATVGAAPFLPQSAGELQTLLDAYVLDKAVYELRYELNNRPAWARIPIEGVLQLLR